MLHFIESRIQKYANTWWEPYKENHPYFKHWWENTRHNATTICPDDLLGFSGASSIYDIKNSHHYSKQSIGYKTETSVIWKATKKSEKIRLLRPLTYSWCGAAYLAGSSDALFQQFHNDIHLGTFVTDWFIDKSDSLQAWYIHSKNSIHDWWEHDEHWWQ